MAEHWHLAPQTGEVKGNNPYQLNRMTVDSSFRTPTLGYDLAKIQGYSATGDVILKGDRLSLAPPRDGCPSAQQGGARHHHRHNLQQHQVQSQAIHNQTQTQIQIQTQTQRQTQTDGYARPDFTPTVTMTTVENRINSGTTDWQQAFSTGLTQSHMDHLTDLTDARYKAIMGESVHY
jgi:hypothetical protein